MIAGSHTPDADPPPTRRGMRNALPAGPNGFARYGFTCQCCGRLVVTGVDGLFDNPARGSTQRFCGPACRQAAHRRRRAGASESSPRLHAGGRRRRLAPPDQGGAKPN